MYYCIVTSLMMSVCLNICQLSKMAEIGFPGFLVHVVSKCVWLVSVSFEFSQRDLLIDLKIKDCVRSKRALCKLCWLVAESSRSCKSVSALVMNPATANRRHFFSIREEHSRLKLVSAMKNAPGLIRATFSYPACQAQMPVGQALFLLMELPL
jgi:hypothetical protein